MRDINLKEPSQPTKQRTDRCQLAVVWCDLSVTASDRPSSLPHNPWTQSQSLSNPGRTTDHKSTSDEQLRSLKIRHEAEEEENEERQVTDYG